MALLEENFALEADNCHDRVWTLRGRPSLRRTYRSLIDNLTLSVAINAEVSAIRRRATALYLAMILWVVPWAGAYQEPHGGELPNLDYRPRALVTSSLSLPSRQAALAKLQRQLPGVRVRLEQSPAVSLVLGSVSGFLTPADAGAGGGMGPGAGDPRRLTRNFVDKQRDIFGFGAEALDQARTVRAATTPHNGMRTTVWQQEFLGLQIFGACVVSHTTRDDALITISSHFVAPPEMAVAGGAALQAVQTEPLLDLPQAVTWAGEAIGCSLSSDEVQVIPESALAPAHRQRCRAPSLLGEAEACLIWLPLEDGQLVLCWQILLTSAERGEMFRVLIDAKTGQLWLRHNLTAYAAPASYRVFPSDSPTPFSPGYLTPNSTPPAGVARQLITTVALDTNASPNGWINDGGNETFGNNVAAHLDRNNDNLPDFPRPQGAPARVFDFPLDLASEPAGYTNASVINLFYWINWTHDQLYRLGFTEASGNFQNSNFGRGGLGNDAVLADAQDGGGANNANFTSPPDGSAGRMQMYLWSGPTPDRDGSLDAEIIIHEYVHGLSSRLVGGGIGLWELQSAGMGEGWSDFYALALLSSASDDVNGNFAMGAYSTHRLNGLSENYYFGIRRYPYSTDLTKNPLTFKDIDTAQASPHTDIPRNPVIANRADQVHNMGSVWCVALWEARARLILKHGFEVGNRTMLQLVTDGMKLSPANPNFLQARDAIFQADLVNNQGQNHAELWQAFARRGMGFSATSPSSSSTSGIKEAYDLADELAVLPSEGFRATGPPGGPFIPSSQVLVVTNRGSNALTWSGASSAGWLQLSRLSGSLAAAEAVNVTAALSPEANLLPAGNYMAIAWFTNVTKNVTRSNVFTLRVGYDGLTELFAQGDNDLDFAMFTFVPDGSVPFYSVCKEAIPVLPTDPLGGTAVTLPNDGFVAVDLMGGRMVSLFGVRTNRLFINSNGHITFDSGDATSAESITAHFQRRRVSALFDDLNPQEGGSVSWKQLPDRIAITFLEVPLAGLGGANTFQIELFFSGVIRLSYLSVASSSGLVGLSSGNGVPPGFDDSDFSTYAACTVPGSLQAVVNSATPGRVIYLPRGVYSGPVVIDRNLVLQGSASSNTFINGAGGGTVLTVNTNCRLVLAGITLQNGDATGGPGGIRNVGELEIWDCSVRNNLSRQTHAGGLDNHGTLITDHLWLINNRSAFGPGALLNFNSARLTNTAIYANVGERSAGGLDNRGFLALASSSVYSNVAGTVNSASGGGIDNSGSLDLDRSTVSGNKALGGSGGGLLNRSAGQARLFHVTIAQNEAATSGGGIDHNATGMTRMTGSVLSGNLAPVGANFQGSISSEGWNFLQSTPNNAVLGPGDIVGSDPWLGSLRDNGGPTWTHALHGSSLALDGGAVSTAVADQRGFARSFDWPQFANANLGGPDMGSLELHPTDTALLRAVSAVSTRQDVTGWVGARWRVGARPVRVIGLGRFMTTGNKSSHTLKIVGTNGVDLAGGSVQVSPFMTLRGGFAYASFATPLTLSAKSSWYLVSSENVGADRWLDGAAVETGRSALLADASVVHSNGQWIVSEGTASGRALVNVLLESCPRTPPDVSLALPTSATLRAAGSSVGLDASASDCDGLVTEVEFFANETWLGKDLTPPFSLTWSNLPAGDYAVTARAKDDTGLSATSAVVNVSVVAFTSRAFVTNKTLGSLRNDFNGWVGMQFTTGTKSVPLLALGRIFVAGNSGQHQLKVVRVSDGSDVPGTLVSVNMVGGTDGQFRYASLPDLVVLPPNTAFYLVSFETLNGDRWYDLNTVLSVAPVAACNGPVWGSGGGWNASIRPNNAFVPVDFIYGDAPARAPVITSQPVSRSVAANDSVGFEVVAEGEPPLRYQWRFNSSPLSGATGSVLSLGPAQLSHAGNYDVIVANASGAVTSQVAVLTVTAGGNGERSFVLSKTPGRARADFSGWVGMKLTTGPAALTVTHLGRIVLSGNTATHNVKLVHAGTGLDVAGGMVIVGTSGGVPGEFRYVALGSPISLSANSSYYLVSQETLSGDTWHDLETTVTTTTAAQCNGAVWGAGSGWNVLGGANQTYVPVDFKYSSAPPSPTVNIVSPSSGTEFTEPADIPVTATVDHAPAVVDKVEFYRDAVKVGEDTSAPYTFTWSGASAGTYGFTARALFTGGAVTSSVVTVIVRRPADPGSSGFVTAMTAGTARNNFSGLVGMKITVGANPLTVTELGRLKLPGNTAAHTIKLVDAANGIDVPGAMASIALNGRPDGQFAYIALASPITLAARGAYYLVSTETVGGDSWYDLNTVLTVASDGTCDGAVWNGGSGWNLLGGPNRSYVPVNFRYSTTTPPPPQLAVSLTSPLNGETFVAPAQITLTAEATQGQNPVSRVEFYSGTAKLGEDTSAPFGFVWSNVVVGTYSLSARVIDAAQGQATSTVAQVSVHAAGANNTFITSASLGKQRNDFGGWVGLKFTVGAAPLQVSALGRMMVAGNNASHRLKLVDAITGQDVSGGFVDVTMAGGTGGLFRYGSLAVPISLPAGRAFYLVSQEVLGGDRWHDLDTSLATASIATCDGAVWSGGSGWNFIARPNQGYVPLDFQFISGPAPPSVAITRPADNAVFIAPGIVDVEVSASSGASAITTVELYRDQTRIGDDSSAPYAFAWSNAVPGSYSLTARAFDLQGFSATSAPVRVTITEPGTAATLLTSKTPGTLRQDFAGWVGMKITVGPSAFTVTELGRMVVAGNSASHLIKLVRTADGTDVASVLVATSGGTPGQIRYASLTSPVTLPARSSYYLVSQETLGGDQWFDLNTAVTTSSAATCDGPVYGSGGGWNLIALPNRSYVPVDLRYLSGSINDEIPEGEGGPRLSIELVGGVPRLTVAGTPGTTVLIEASDDLLQWEQVLWQTLQGSVERVAVPETPGQMRAYYRAVLLSP